MITFAFIPEGGLNREIVVGRFAARPARIAKRGISRDGIALRRP